MKRLRKKKKATRSHQNKTANAFFPGVQTKLSIGKADDAFEKEADHVADNVVNNSTDQGGIMKKESEEEQIQEKPADTITPIQKMGGEEEQESPVQKVAEKEEEPVQKMEEEEAAIQTKSTGQKHNSSNGIESKLKSSKGDGSRMNASTLNQMEQGFGADFSHVNIHTGTAAEAMSEQIGAQAFTNGNDIYFNKGKYNPSSSDGKHLLAHELTHTIQQKGKSDKKVQRKVKLSGTDAKTREKFLAKMNDGSSVKFKFGTDGEVELVDKKAVGTDVFSKKMIGALKNPQTVGLKLIVKNDRVFIDSFASGAVDSADMLGLSTTMFKASLIHFVVERFTLADYEKNKATASKADFDKAHAAGLSAEEEFLKEIYPKKTIKYTTEYLDKKSKVVDKDNNGSINYIIDFTDVQYVFTQPIVNGKTLENITKSNIKVK